MKTRMKRDSYNVGRLLKEVRSDHAEHAKNAGIVLELDPPEGVLDARIYVRALRRALNNLIRNALRFTPRGGNVWLGAYRQGDEIVLFVRDNGPGIDPTLRDQIFELGFTQSGSGSGLGLTIAKEFIELHDGRITVEGSMGEGAKFRIILPVGAQEE
jgi:signal transduction histidine kinase